MVIILALLLERAQPFVVVSSHVRSQHHYRAALQPEEGPGIKFRTRAEEEKKEAPVVEKAQMSTINAQLLAEIEAAKGSIRLEAPQIEVREEVDISDVNPAVAVASSVATICAAYFMWQFTTFMTISFAEHPFQSDFYPVQRFAGLVRQVVVGASSLLTGLTAATGIGVGVLGIKVALDPPSQSAKTPTKEDDARERENSD